MNKKQKKSFTQQLQKAFITVILIPVLCFGGFIYYISFRYIQQEKLMETKNIIQQNRIDLNNRMEACSNSLRYLVANYELQEFLTINEKDYLEISKTSKNIGSLVYNVILTNQYYKSLTLYSNKEISVLRDFLKSNDQVKKEDWYQKIIQSKGAYWWHEGDKLFIGRKITTAYPVQEIGVIKIELKEDILKESFNVFKDMPIKIVITAEDEKVYEYEHAEWEDHIKFQQTYDLGNTRWKITYQVDDKYYNYHMLISIGPPMLIISIVIVLVWLMIYFFTKLLAKDLFILVQEVNEVRSGNLDVKIQPATITEIHTLAESIQSLINKIKQLIREVYVSEIERQNLEINLLQSKMSPHFLYNNLSAINWLALECGQNKIYEITTEMATFYRTALNKGKNIDKLAVELDNIKAYLNLQLIAHEYSFDVVYDIEEKLLEYEVPIFMMQPLVENAIEHGIDQLRSGKGLIKISVKCEEEWMYIKIYDNGTALFEQIGATQLRQEDFGYGISNIQKRIQLLYGAQSGLSIKTNCTGTVSEICFLYKNLKIINRNINL